MCVQGGDGAAPCAEDLCVSVCVCVCLCVCVCVCLCVCVSVSRVETVQETRGEGSRGNRQLLQVEEGARTKPRGSRPMTFNLEHPFCF